MAARADGTICIFDHSVRRTQENSLSLITGRLGAGAVNMNFRVIHG
jgi:hypothetical protein